MPSRSFGALPLLPRTSVVCSILDLSLQFHISLDFECPKTCLEKKKDFPKLDAAEASFKLLLTALLRAGVTSKLGEGITLMFLCPTTIYHFWATVFLTALATSYSLSLSIFDCSIIVHFLFFFNKKQYSLK